MAQRCARWLSDKHLFKIKTNKACRGERFLTATGFVVGFLSHPEDIGEADAADANPKENALNEGTEAYAAQRVYGYVQAKT